MILEISIIAASALFWGWNGPVLSPFYSMFKSFRSTLLFTLLAAGAITGCRKENGINNDQVIQKPYSLYVSDNDGALFNTNDGQTYKTLFPPDGTVDRAIATSGPNLLWLKSQLYLSEGGDKAFNPTYRFITGTDRADWQPVIYSSASHNRVYLSSTAFGIVYSEDAGKNWVPDTAFNAIGPNPQPSYQPTSFVQLENGLLFARDNAGQYLFYRVNKTARWQPFQGGGLPAGGRYFLNGLKNTLQLVDERGTQGVWFSNDTGANWQQYAGIPTDRRLLCAASPFGLTTLVGTMGNGVYRLDRGVFVPSSAGMDGNSDVWGIVGKNNLYKNETDLLYVFASTSTGLYRSEDGGTNWIKVRAGNYHRVY